ncbi:unnamed protein product [Cuscuta campestris]|uniref:BSD domain-containing protein n=1 Tax=Cuscuta campestris TaxID=132261 RepID=A0A484M703_9ASTE|nr:unnamed protein product [Cuscuta campestris]
MDFWLKARSLAEEAAKLSQELTMEAAKRSHELTIEGSAKFSDVVLEASKRSKEIAAEASKRSKEIVAEASKRADQIKVDALKRAEQIKAQIPAASISHLVHPSSITSTKTMETSATSADLERFGVTDDLREFIKGITMNTFQDFPLQDISEMSAIPTVSNVCQDLNKFQEKHAKLVLSSVKEISKLRYALCPRVMRERTFWKIYFILVKSHVDPFEKRYIMEEAELKSAAKTEVQKDYSSSGTTSKTTVEGNVQTSKKTTSSTTEQDLDIFLLGEDSDDGPDDGVGVFDDDFDKI